MGRLLQPSYKLGSPSGRAFATRTTLVALTLGTAALGSAQTWTIQALPKLTGTETYGHSVNGRGDVAGEATLADGSVRAVVWKAAGGTTDLGSLTGTSNAKAFKINATGQVAGYSINNSGVCTATFWDGTGAHSIGTLGGNNSRAFSLNDRGEVVGTADFTYGSRAFSWTLSGGIVDRGNLSPEYRQAYGGANDINNDGYLVGTMYNLFEPFRAVRADPGGKVQDMATPGRTNSEALGINNQGVMVGYSNGNGTGNGEHAAIFDGRGNYTDLGTLPGTDASQATDINENGWIVGRAVGFEAGYQTSFLYRNKQMVDLMSLLPANSGWEMLYSAEGINDNGMIVGTGVYNGETRAFALRPVPEPATIVGLLVGAGALLRRRRNP